MLRWIILFLLIASSPLSVTIACETAQITFAVGCYDVGAAALKDHPGVLDVEKGWQGFREVNRVQYDPQLVKIEQLERWLQQAETWRATLPTSKELSHD
ncbi:hypothetical protein [Geopsychrobacter electrodiphilus]|uniref:hypothetical protein n=1 Tax=Geopsychrobacter electrodiphilus TaxID=225196 RepID=UPI000376DDD0|nr:hypothetical protein [Geopsychrobacter electrodiphilus]